MSETASLDAEVLLAHVLARSRSWILAHPEYLLDEIQVRQIEHLVERLLSGEPLPYILGHWEFYGLDFILSPAVLIPRPETELLVENALGWLKLHSNRRLVLDVGTGSGCIAVSLAVNCPDVKIVASDISWEALLIARDNLERHCVNGKVHLLQSDLIPPTPQPFDLLCANLPYIPADDLPYLPVASYEPALALNGGLLGTSLIERFLAGAPRVLAQGGLALLEIEASQGSWVTDCAQAAFPQADIHVLPDLVGRDRLLAIQSI